MTRGDLEIHERVSEEIQILDLRGRLVIGQSEAVLRQAITALVNNGIVNIVLNCARLKEIDDDGLEALTLCSAKVRTAHGHMKLLNLVRGHLGLIVLTGLDSEFESFADEQDAVNSFFPDRAIRHFDILEFVETEEETHSPSEPDK